MTRPLAAIVLLTATITACGPSAPTTPATETEVTGRLIVYTVNYPLAYFAERIGGELVEVRFPAPADEDPAYWSPDAETIAAYQSADLILLNGAAYAKWVERATLPSSKLVDTAAAFAERCIPLEGSLTHSHGPGGEHEHTGWAFTTWLDPTLAAEQARAVAAALVRERPEHEAAIQVRFAILESALLTLDARLQSASTSIGDEPLIFSHPVYQYLERHYELNGASVHWEPDQAPDLDELRHLLEDHPAEWMVWEAEPLAETVQALEALGVGNVVFDPCANRPSDGDFMSVMDANATALEAISNP